MRRFFPSQLSGVFFAALGSAAAFTDQQFEFESVSPRELRASDYVFLSAIIALSVSGLLLITWKEWARRAPNDTKSLSDDAEAIHRVAQTAAQLFLGEKRVPFGRSKLGGEFGLFSSLRHPPEEAATFVGKLAVDPTQRKQTAVAMLQSQGSLWSDKGFNHSMTNYFLVCLRWENTELYRQIVGEAYGIKFISGGITLYRRDERPCTVIFTEGFQLKPDSNSPLTRKTLYVEPVTYSHGVSFAKGIPPVGYGNPNAYYEVVLPRNHPFLLVDVADSPRNKGKLTPYQLRLQEVNSLDGLPPEVVRGINEGLRFFENPRFRKDGMIRPLAPPSPMGCY